ncbi:MAG: hypothetical protein DI596_01350, partial [Azospira oryzae]
VAIDNASAAIYYPLHLQHLALVIWQAEDDDLAELQRFVDGLAAAVNAAAGPLLVAADRATAWVWLPFRSVPAQLTAEVREYGTARAKSLNIAMGAPGSGVQGFRRSHRQAQRARTAVLARDRRPPGSTRVLVAATDPTVMAGALLDTGIGEVRGWVVDVLGDLACDTEDDAVLREEAGEWRPEGDPTEGALVALACKAGLDPRMEAEEHPRVDTIPFESEHRFMATLHHDHAGHTFVYLKGAPERVLALCQTQRSRGEDRPLDLEYWRRRIEETATAGQRVLAAAYRAVEPGRRELLFADVEQGGFTLLALFGLIDPPREEAIQAVARCRAAGIRVKMITGDHAVTARAIGAQLGIGDGARALTGMELESMDDTVLCQAVKDTDVFARASPEHKLRLVEALQANAEAVAMTGDGVNDAPALKRADVGIAMGRKGTEAAKEAAAMVLADDNFASIAHAVEEGRTVYDNLRKAITFLLPINGGESLSLVAAILTGVTLPVTPLQILWVNMVSSVGLALALAFEPTEPDVMRRPPRPVGEPILSGFLLWRIALVSALFLAGIFGMFEWSLARGASVEEARTVAVNTLVAMEVFYLFSVRYLRTPSFTFEGVKGTRPVLAAVFTVFGLQLLFTYAPFMGLFFGSRSLTISQGVGVVAVGVALLVILEVEKCLWRRRATRREGCAA